MYRTSRGETCADLRTPAYSEWRAFGVLPLVAALGYSNSVLHLYSIGTFIQPLQQEFGWSRATATMGVTIVNLAVAIFCAPIGILVDRIGPRLIGVIGALLVPLAYALLGTATGGYANWILLWSLVALGSLWVQSPIWTSAVATRFEASRGLAFAVTLSGASVGAALFPLLASRLIAAYGWRFAFVALGCAWAALVVPLIFLFFRGARDHERAPATTLPAQTNALSGVSVSEGLRSAAFYKLLIAGAAFAFTTIGIVVHFVPVLTDSGAEPLAAAGIAALVGICAIIGRLGTGVLLDRFAGRFVGAAIFGLGIVACALLLTVGTAPVAQVMAAAMIGLTLGAEVDVIAYLGARHFGLKSFGVLFGGLVAALALGAALGPLAAGMTFDAYGTYAPFIVSAIALMAVSSLALASLGPPRFSSHGRPPAS